MRNNKISIIHSAKYGTYWKIEDSKDIFKNINTVGELQKKAFSFILNGNKNFNYILDIIDNEKIKFIRISAKEYVYGRSNKKLEALQYREKMRAAPSIDDLIMYADIKYHSPLKHPNKLFCCGYNNYQGKMCIDDDVFRYIVRVGKTNKSDSIFYDVSLKFLGKENEADNKVLGT